MIIAKMRVNEAKDICALTELEILDTEREFEFDSLAEIAAASCDTPIASVSFVDKNRQWFKAASGMPEATETPRAISFCSHAVLGKEIFEVPDSTKDKRFSSNPFVTGESNVRFYAGAPLVMSGGACVGAICVIDHKPRLLTEAQRQILNYLASMCVKALERRLATKKMGEVIAAIGESSNKEGSSSSGVRNNSLMLVEAALKTVDDAMQSLFKNESVVETVENELVPLEYWNSESPSVDQLAEFPTRPSEVAIQLCLTSTCGLLHTVHSLIQSDGVFRPLARAKHWKDLAASTKLAGRAAYRASLLLLDPLANDAASWDAILRSLEELRHQELWSTTGSPGEDRQWVLARCWEKMQGSGVTLMEFEEFLSTQSEIQGIDVSYVFQDIDGKEQTYSFDVSDLPDQNPMVLAIKDKTLTRAEALNFATNEKGRDWVESNFGTL